MLGNVKSPESYYNLKKGLKSMVLTSPEINMIKNNENNKNYYNQFNNNNNNNNNNYNDDIDEIDEDDIPLDYYFHHIQNKKKNKKINLPNLNFYNKNNNNYYNDDNINHYSPSSCLSPSVSPINMNIEDFRDRNIPERYSVATNLFNKNNNNNNNNNNLINSNVFSPLSSPSIINKKRLNNNNNNNNNNKRKSLQPPTPHKKYHSPLIKNNNRHNNISPSYSKHIGRFSTEFEILEVLGKGSFGTVYKVRSLIDQCLYAIKSTHVSCPRRKKKKQIYDYENNDQIIPKVRIEYPYKMMKEVNILARICTEMSDDIRSRHIVRYHQGWVEDDEDNINDEDNFKHKKNNNIERIFIVMELCDKSLEQELNERQQLLLNNNNNNNKSLFSIKESISLLRQMTMALSLLHSRDFVHLDIKTANIFIKHNTFKLGDFGLAISSKSSSDDIEEGDSRYMARELLEFLVPDLTKCDIFSLGIMMYEIITEKINLLPSSGEEWHNLRNNIINFDKINNNNNNNNINVKLSEDEMQLHYTIRKLMYSAPERRPSADELLTLNILADPKERELKKEKKYAQELEKSLLQYVKKNKKSWTTM